MTDNDIMLGGEGFDHCLLLVADLFLSIANCKLSAKTNLLKPWIMICLIYITAVAGRGVDIVSAVDNLVLKYRSCAK